MNYAQRKLIKDNLRLARWKKGRPLTKDEGTNILQAHLNTTLKKKENFQPKSEPTQIGDLLGKFRREIHQPQGEVR